MNLLKKIEPAAEGRKNLEKEINSFINLLNKKLKNAKAVLGGSFAKNTWLAGDHDVDTFVKFDYKKFWDKDISKILKNYLKNCRTIHGSRNYYQIKKGKLTYELIPVLAIKNAAEAMNVTDISPLHAEYVKNNSNLKLQNEIRLTKQFFKANKLYGAESHIRGFSGYVLEVLTIYYKSFNNLIIKVSRWKEKEIIDPIKFYKSRSDIIMSLNEAKQQSPLILIDPVQPDRNVAAALNKEKYDLLKRLAKKYIKAKNKESFFEVKKLDLKNLKGYFVIEAVPLTGKTDIIGSKMLKIFEYTTRRLNEEGFSVLKSGWNFDDRTYFWFKVKNKKLSRFVKHYGPIKEKKEHLEIFKKKWKRYKIYSEENKVYVNLKRKFIDAREFLKNLIKDEYIKNKAKFIKLL